MDWFQEILVLLPIARKLFESFESSSSEIFVEFLLKLGKAHHIVERKWKSQYFSRTFMQKQLEPK